MTFIPIDTGIPDSFITRIILDSDFTEGEHKRRMKQMCGGCNCGDFNKFHTCIHTAECTYETLKYEGVLLPEADTEECPDNRGVYLVYKEPPVGRDEWLKKFKTPTREEEGC